MKHLFRYSLDSLRPYVNWVYFFHAWGMPPRFATVAATHDCPACRAAWLGQFDGQERAQAEEAARLFTDAARMLRELEPQCEAKGLCAICPVWSEGEDLVIATEETVGNTEKGAESAEETAADAEVAFALLRLPLLRQQYTAHEGDACLCLSDYISPHRPSDTFIRRRLRESAPYNDTDNTLCIFATAADWKAPHHPAGDKYEEMLRQTLLDRMAEAAAEKMHEEVRRTHWGYVPDEHLTPRELLEEKYQGLRPAVGYPSLPDQSFIFLLDQAARFADIGVSLTESGMMLPHAATAGLMFGHKAARHFGVGRIDRRQLADYARRRDCTEGYLRRFLAGNIADTQ